MLYGSTHVHIPYLEGSTTIKVGSKTTWFSTSALLLSFLCRSVKEYNTAEEEASHFEVVGLFRSIGSFIGIFLGSFLLGCTMALLTALVSSSSKDIPLSKWRNDYKNNAVSSSSSDSDHNKCAICWVGTWVSHAVRSHFTASTTHTHTHTLQLFLPPQAFFYIWIFSLPNMSCTNLSSRGANLCTMITSAQTLFPVLELKILSTCVYVLV